MKKCTNCDTELKWMGGIGEPIDGANAYCPNCGVIYKDDEPIAVQKGNKIIKL